MAMWRAFEVPDNAVVQSEEMLRMFSGLFADKHAMEPCFNSYFDAMDFNNNGQISKEEYGILFDCVGIGRDRLDVAFEALDTDRRQIETGSSRETILFSLLTEWFIKQN
ncbi:hypothetical protein EMCRGX_G000677 [Ephydatia muelleri]